jgi:hypothetical protein
LCKNVKEEKYKEKQCEVGKMSIGSSKEKEEKKIDK